MARLAHEEGMWLDVSTGGELHVALSAGVPAERLVLHGYVSGELALELNSLWQLLSSAAPSGSEPSAKT